MKKINKKTIDALVYIGSSLIIVLVLVFALFALSDATNEGGYLRPLLAATFICLSLSRLPLAVNAIKNNPSKIVMWKNFAFSFVYLVCGIIIIFSPTNYALYGVISGIYLFTIVANRVCSCIQKPHALNIVINAFLATLFFLLGLVFMTSKETFNVFVVASLVVIMFTSIFDILSFAFSQIRLKGLIKIVKKTYVLQILYGLLIMVLSFSVYFMIMEEGITNYGDALWYSFAIITTIGFGDVVVTDTIGRILSVILGCYGIIVVAAITSVIVNYYNETKNDEKNESEKEIEENKQPEEVDKKEEK